MDYLAKAVNAVKDGYLYVIEGIAGHPHIACWTAIALIGLALAA